ncbi:hypothetical protein Q4R49_20715, partial [Morganella morganii subsp. sibonii]
EFSLTYMRKIVDGLIREHDGRRVPVILFTKGGGHFRAAKQPYGAEALGLMSYSLREQSILFTLTVEFWMTLSQAEQRNPARLQGMQETKAAAAMLTGSALDYLGLTAQFERQDLVLYSA